MVTTQHLCAACGSEYIRRNGSAAGHAKYQCKACGHQARFMPAAVAKAAQYAQVDKLLVERNSQRSIVRVTGVSRMSVAKRLKKALAPPPRLPRRRSKQAQKKRWEALELEEMWTFVGQKKRKVWLWLAVERASRRVVAWVTGRGGATRPRPGDGGRPCRVATNGTAGTSLTRGRPMRAYCPAGSTAAVRRVVAAPAS